MNAPQSKGRSSASGTLCSTPFGDIDECTVVWLEESRQAQACSTPFGDIDECTWLHINFGSESPVSAQRLSATLMNALLNERSESFRHISLCSTPFGDIDECTASLVGVCLHGLHGVCSTPFGDIDECTSSCSTTGIFRWCAQRLSATLMNAPQPIRDDIMTVHMLCSTPFGDIDECTRHHLRLLAERDEVLNAFRRH